MSDFAEILDNIDNMPYDSQEIIVDIINKRFTEKKRDHFIEETLNSENEYLNGQITSGNSEDLFRAMSI